MTVTNLQETPREWKNQPYNFDNIGMALVSLFVTATLNGYTGKVLLWLWGVAGQLP